MSVEGNNPLCHVDDIGDGTSKGFVTEQLSLFIVREKGLIYAYKNACPHLGLALEWQPDRFLTSDQSLIQCATHGALFEIHTGACIYGPCQGRHLSTVKTIIKDGYIYLSD